MVWNVGAGGGGGALLEGCLKEGVAHTLCGVECGCWRWWGSSVGGLLEGGGSPAPSLPVVWNVGIGGGGGALLEGCLRKVGDPPPPPCGVECGGGELRG